jgi:hypothetical protein
MSNVSVAQLKCLVLKLANWLRSSRTQALKQVREKTPSPMKTEKTSCFLARQPRQDRERCYRPKKVTLSANRSASCGYREWFARATARTVNVEVRKIRTYVKREWYRKRLGRYSDREEARKILEQSRAERAEKKASASRQTKHAAARRRAAQDTRRADQKAGRQGAP